MSTLESVRDRLATLAEVKHTKRRSSGASAGFGPASPSNETVIDLERYALTTLRSVARLVEVTPPPLGTAPADAATALLLTPRVNAMVALNPTASRLLGTLHVALVSALTDLTGQVLTGEPLYLSEQRCIRALKRTGRSLDAHTLHDLADSGDIHEWHTPTGRLYDPNEVANVIPA